MPTKYPMPPVWWIRCKANPFSPPIRHEGAGTLEATIQKAERLKARYHFYSAVVRPC